MMNGVKTRTTHIAEVRERHANQIDEVCALFEWSADKYCMNQFEQYQRFCAMLADKDRELRRRLEYSPVFRGFWNNEWAERNAVDFLPFARKCDSSISYILSEYEFIHEAGRLIRCECFAARFEQIFKSI